MHETNLFLLFVERLERNGISYMITGSVASIVYGEAIPLSPLPFPVGVSESRRKQVPQQM